VPNHFCIGNVVDNDFCHFGEVPAIPSLDNNERQIRRPAEEEDTLTLMEYMLISLPLHNHGVHLVRRELEFEPGEER